MLISVSAMLYTGINVRVALVVRLLELRLKSKYVFLKTKPADDAVREERERSRAKLELLTVLTSRCRLVASERKQAAKALFAFPWLLGEREIGSFIHPYSKYSSLWFSFPLADFKGCSHINVCRVFSARFSMIFRCICCMAFGFDILETKVRKQ